jgi:CBS domain-containing protein
MGLEKLVHQPVETILACATLREASRQMCDRSVGALVITSASGEKPLAVLTDRDLVWMIAEGCDPDKTTVDQFVRTPVETVRITESVTEVIGKMHEKSIRRLPVCDAAGKLVGIVSLDDVIVLLADELAAAAGAITGEIEHERHIGAGRIIGGRLSA